MSTMKAINLNNIMQIRTIGFEALREALGTVGTVRFLQQYDLGYGDYTKEKYEMKEEKEEDVYAQLSKI
ncbi:MAG: hypothetical protein J6Y01_07940 [Spirochaetales bacterium]|nr:hypothetical protein [Spirochaetales bacterium]